MRALATRDLQERILSISARAEKKKRSLSQPSAKAHEGLQLPLWPEAVRGVPNSILRSALFGAIRRGRRTFLQRESMASYGDITILQTGPRLDQADLDVFEQCIHLARTGGLGTRIQFAAHGFLKSTGRTTGGKDVEWLKEVFSRLASSVLEIKDGSRAYFGPLLHHGTRDDATGHYTIEINPASVTLYGFGGWSQVEFKQRKALKRQPLAQWLHGFFSTHAAPFPLKVETIHRLSGSENKELKGFRRDLREALVKLEAVTCWGWEIDDADLVHIKKKPTGSQARYLIRKRLEGMG